MDIMTGLVIAISFVALAVVLVVEKIVNSKERIEMEKVRKVKDISEMQMLFPVEEPEAEEEADVTVPLEDLTLDDIIGGNK